MKEFEFVQGSIIGREHRRFNKNNQDAYSVVEDDNWIIATVCDGCSTAVGKDGEGYSPLSEVGSNLICRMFNSITAKRLLQFMLELETTDDEEKLVAAFLEQLRIDCIEEIIRISSVLNSSYLSAINDFFLATVVSVIITRKVAFVASIGDGVIIINGEPYQIGPFKDNEPPYIAYGAVDPERIRVAKELYRFKVAKIMPIEELQTVLIGSDGVEDVVRNCDALIPGKTDTVGPISQFWENPKFFSNPSLLGRKLNLINSDSTKIEWNEKKVKREPGLLDDDTTIVVVRRKTLPT